MALAPTDRLLKLQDLLDAAADGLAKVSSKRMFGCHALFASGSVFAIVWKEGRIGVRLAEQNSFDKLIGLKGSSPWKAGTMTIAHWVLIPGAMLKDKKTLRAWVSIAHLLALSAPKTATKKKVTKKSTKKKIPAKASKTAPKTSKKRSAVSAPKKKIATKKKAISSMSGRNV